MERHPYKLAAPLIANRIPARRFSVIKAWRNNMDYNTEQRQRMIRDIYDAEDWKEWNEARQKDANWFTAVVIGFVIIVVGLLGYGIWI